MTREYIRKMAQEAGIPIELIGKTGALRWQDLERFAALVAAAARYSNDMTLLDYFAAKAMQADMLGGVHEDDFPQSAARAYKMADAMLKERAY